MKTNSIVPYTGNNRATPFNPLSLTDPAGMQLATQANVDIFRRGSLAATREQCRAIVAYTAMESVMMLSVMEAQCYRAAPFGEERYKQIVDAYTAGAVAVIRNF
jgi:hypothetical protein